MQPLTKVQFVVLCALIRVPMHAYAIRQEIDELSGHRYFPSYSTVKNSLVSLEAAGYVEACWSSPHYWMKARRGVPYELTKKGRKLVKRELRMYRELTNIARLW